MRPALIALSLYVLFAVNAHGQGYSYGQPSDLKGLKKVYVDTGADTKSRDSIIRDLQKAKLGFEIADDMEDAEILIGFGAGKIITSARATLSGSQATIRDVYSRTGAGVIIARARGKDRIVHSFSGTQETGAPVDLFKRKPVTNFMREFIGLYRKANPPSASTPVRNIDEWQLVDTAADHMTYYQPSSVTILSVGSLTVWTRLVALDLDAERKRQIALQKTGAGAFKYYKYVYSLVLYGVRCKTRESRLLQVVDYAEGGVPLDSTTFSEQEASWENIVPNSVMDDVRLKVCTAK